MQQKRHMYDSRRAFMKDSSLLAGGLIALPHFSWGLAPSGTDDTIKVAVVGCGGRGTGAALQALASKQRVKIVALADAFQDNLEQCLNTLRQEVEEQGGSAADVIAVNKETLFTGFDGYKKAIPLADVVILATPPGFRPIHFAEAIAQNKHVFMEKPVATDPAGVASVLQTAQLAKEKKRNVVVGLQRHYQSSYLSLFDKKEMIGEITSMQAWWNSDGVWVRPRKYNQTEMEYQMRNWYYFNWLCGDHITEQHIHNLDVANWFKESYPVKAQGMGGRQVRKGKDHGEIFDHHYVEYTYADGSTLHSQCRHIPGTTSKVDELLTGTKGKIACGAGRITDHKGKVLFQFDMKGENNPYQTEHDELFAAIAEGKCLFADADNAAKSTLTSIIGRMATYSGQEIETEKALQSGISLQPESYDWNALPRVLPNEDGHYQTAVPGITKYF